MSTQEGILSCNNYHALKFGDILLYCCIFFIIITKILAISKGQGITCARTLHKIPFLSSFHCKHFNKYFLHHPKSVDLYLQTKLVHTLVYFMDILFSLSTNPYAFCPTKI